jgi:transcription termination factor Rho
VRRLRGGLTRAALEGRHLADLHELASANRIPRYRTLERRALVDAILDAQPPGEEPAAAPEEPPAAEETPAAKEDDTGRPEETGEPVGIRAGVLDVVPDGYGFLRVEALRRSDDDVYVSRSLVRSFGLRSGDELEGPVGAASRSRRYPSLLDLTGVNGGPAEEFRGHERPEFEKLTPIAPAERIPIAARSNSLSVRMVDLLASIGKGQRCLISSPPGAGATTLLRDIGQALSSAGEAQAMVLLVDVRPEEVTEWRRAIDAPVYGAASDSSPESHVRLAELALECARRMTEQGKDAVLLIDSLTRLARARSLVQGRSRRATPPDDDEAPAENPALRSAKRWFSAARKTEEQGSLTIAGIVRVDSDSEFEQLVYELLADSANMELRLDGELARAGFFPPLDVNRCWSHLEEGAIDPDAVAWLGALRHSLSSLAPADAWHAVTERLLATSSNSELVDARPEYGERETP